MSSKVAHQIKGRNVANDVFITPLELAKKHIEMVESSADDIWLDPCKNSGAYYNQFPTDNKDYCEILENKDFFDYNKKVDIIISNPPYSIMDKWINKNIELKPRIIGMLISIGNLTTKRIALLENAGYGLTKMKMMKVYEWFGMSAMVIFEKGKESIIEYDRTVYYDNSDEATKRREEKKLENKKKRELAKLKKAQNGNHQIKKWIKEFN